MSEAKTKAVQAEAKQEAKTVAKTQETMVYAGPTILGVATHNQFFNNGLPDGLKTAMEKEPAIYNLVVPISNLAAVNADIALQSGAAYVFYKNFKWSLPHLNLPHISVSGGQAPYGIAGKGSLPKFSIEWYKNGGIMTQPTAFGINPESGNLMAGGEAGPEAIVPLSQLWEKMTTILKGILAESQNGGAGNALSALVDKVGAAMQGSTQTPISGLLDRLSGGGNEPQPATANGAPINYAPVYNFNGAAPTKDDLVEAERMSQAEFNEMMEQWQRDNDRKRF